MQDVFKAIAALTIAAWENWDDSQLARGFDPLERLAQYASGFNVDKPNCIAQLMYFYQDNPLDLTLDQVVELCRDYVES
jgi:hypothetical protein